MPMRGEGVGDEPADAATGPDEAVLLEQHQGLADHGAADFHVRSEFGLGGENGAWLQQVVARGFGERASFRPLRGGGSDLRRVIVRAWRVGLSCGCHEVTKVHSPLEDGNLRGWKSCFP
jgi:hypothetical protein